MTIIQVVSTLERGGPVNVVYNIMKYTTAVNKVIITLSEEKENSMLDDFVNLGCDIFKLNEGKFSSKRNISNKIKQIIYSYKDVVIHSHGIRADYYVNYMNKTNKLKHVTTSHNYPYDDYPQLYKRIIGNIIARKHISVFKKIPTVVSCSKYIYDKFINHNINSKVVRNGVDVLNFSLLNDIEKSKLRKKMGYKSDDYIYITTGSMIPRKRPIELVKDFNDSFTNFDDSPILIMLGDGPLFNEVVHAADQSIKIHIKGRVNNVEEYLKISDVFISNSRSEGLPMAGLEALSSGLKLFMTDIEPHKEIYDLSHKNVKLYDINERIDFVHSYKWSKSSDIDLNIKKEISAELMANSYDTIYKSLLNKKNL